MRRELNMRHLAYFHVPLQVMLIDDNSTFTKSLALALRRHRAILPYSNSLEAAIGLENIQKEQVDLHDELNQLHQQIYQSNRFDSLGIIITDYTMPGLNGLDLCRKAPENTKRILLTGEADERIAVEAFNQGLIHRYIKKDVSDIVKSIEMAIEELEFQYYQELSEGKIVRMQKNPEQTLTSLFDFEFIRYVEAIFKKHEIVEYYLFDDRGSLLALDRQANYFVVAVRDAEDMKAAAEIAQFEDVPVSKEVLDATSTRSKLLFTGRQNDISLSANQWEQYLFPVEFIDQNQQFYVTLIHNPPINLDKDRIVSFTQYLENFYQK